MEYFDLVKTRRSIRRYKDEPVLKGDILKVLDAANWAPSAMNLQPWEFIVVSGESLQPLAESFKSIVERFVSTFTEDGDVISSDDFINYASNFGGAPVIIVVLTEVSEESNVKKSYLESASAAMENLVLAAADLGLGACWMTGPLRDEESLRQILDISPDKELVAVTPLGYPEEVPRPLPRVDAELKEKVKWIGL